MMNKIFFLFFFSPFVLFSQNINDLFFGTENTLDIVSWNIEWFPKNTNTADYVEEILTNLEADIYALQEIQDTILLKQVVSNIAGYDCYFDNNYHGGLAIVYNSNVIQVNSLYEIFTAQAYWSAFPRSPQLIDFNFMGNNYILINNHFKCCGDGFLDLNNSNDEEFRRYQAITYLKQFIDNNFSNKRVILTGDLNDDLNDINSNNIFQDFILDNTNYLFVDMQIAQGSSLNWSYPSWPSHLDHFLITDELFSDFNNPNSIISVIKVDDYMGSWANYENNVSDHRPIGLKLDNSTINNFNVSLLNSSNLLYVKDIFGREVTQKKNIPLFYFFEGGTVEKRIVN